MQTWSLRKKIIKEREETYRGIYIYIYIYIEREREREREREEAHIRKTDR